MDKIFINNFRLEASIGVLAWEKAVKQPIILDLALGLANGSEEHTGDAIENTLDYQKVTSSIKDFIQSQHFNLVQTLANALATFLLDQFKLPWIKIKLTKPFAIENVAAVGIEIERG